MTTPSPKLGLALPAQTDPFSTADIKSNWQKIDAAPGSFICTSSTRPVWTSAQAGRKILETNTGLEWMWDGTQFVRLSASGLLKCSDGSWAIGERTTDFATTSLTYVIVVKISSVVIPAGNRPIRAEVVWRAVDNPNGTVFGAIYRSATAASGPLQTNWNFAIYGGVGTAAGGTFFSIERNGLSAGIYDFSFQVHSSPTTGGTSTIHADTITPASIFISEM